MKPTKNTQNTTNNLSCHSRENGNPAKASVWTEINSFRAGSPRSRGGQTHHHRPSHGFTLVELIVVITILVVLGTIAFTSLSGFAGGARDSSRVSDLANLSQGLELTYIKTGSYPNPDDSFAVTYSGGVLWTQGTVGDTVINILGSAGAKFSRKPMDPLTTTTPYTYSKLAYGNAYQLKTDWEGDSVAYRNNLISQTYASSGNPTLAYIKGTYNGMVAKTQSGSTIFLLAVPSIITTQSGALDPTKFLIHGQTNSGGLANSVIASKLLVYSSGSLPSNDMERILFASGIALAYSGTALASQSNIASFITALGNTGTLASLWGGLLSASLGGSASASSTPPASVTYSDCTFNATPVTHSTSVTAYQTASVSFGNTCAQEQRTCTDGTLSGTYTFASCTVDGATGTFTLSQASVTQGTNPTISHNCSTAPTSYTSSNTAVATIADTTITTLSVWTTNITPVGWACADVGAKTLTVTAPQYPWCTTPDILVGWKYWAACNVGATTAWTTQTFVSATTVRDATVNTWAGGLYQWGNNADVSYSSTTAGQVTCTNTPNWSNTATFRTGTADWCTAQSDDLWGHTTNTNIARKGPCATDYHVPTQSEWASAVNTITNKTSGWIAADVTALQTTLKLPMAGFRYYSDGSLYFQGTYGSYWSSSPSTTNGYNLYFYSTAIFPADYNYRAYGFSVRCLKN